MHVTLDDSAFRRLATLSRRLKLSRNFLVREAVADYVSRRERETLALEMVHYAEKMAPHSDEFVRETDTEVDRLLLENTQW